jgi:hypothetical protein
MAMVGFSNFCGGCENCIGQRGTMKFCLLTDLQRMLSGTEQLHNPGSACTLGCAMTRVVRHQLLTA